MGGGREGGREGGIERGWEKGGGMEEGVFNIYAENREGETVINDQPHAALSLRLIVGVHMHDVHCTVAWP